jgi:sialic acid synthase SpsE
MDMPASPRSLFIFEMANNHGGSVAHGEKIVQEFRKVADGFPEFDFGFKLQYRDKASLLRPSIQAQQTLPYLKRFTETALDWEQYQDLQACIRAHKFLAVCTPFDEKSAEMIAEHGYDYVKVPSCFMQDSRLHAAIRGTGLPVILSTAGSCLAEIESAVYGTLPLVKIIMHCVAEYPTLDGHLQLHRIRQLYLDFCFQRIGYSTHERGDNYQAVQVARAFGATVFEKHVGVETEKVRLNSYSVAPEQALAWLSAAFEFDRMCEEQETPDVSALEDLRTLREALLA